MKILFCNVAFRGRSGTETYLADLVPAIREQGHEVACLTTTDYPIDTGVGRDLADLGIPVAQEPDRIAWVPDVIHAHHRAPTQLALDAWPGAPAIFFVHDALAPTDLPLLAPSILRYVAVDHLCAERLRALPRERCQVIYNAVNLARFELRRRWPRSRPRRALLFMGHAPDYGFIDVLQQACALRRLPLERMALAEHEEATPELRLGRYDLCFARGRSAMEAIASGLGVICCGSEGLGPFVTPDRYDEARRFNFGRGLLTHAHTVEGVCSRLEAWQNTAVKSVTKRLRSEGSLTRLVGILETLYAEVRHEHLLRAP